MIRIRPATEADVATLFAIRTSVRQNHLSHEQLAELGITPASVAEAISLGPCCWLAEADGVAVGFAMVDGAAGEVFALFVRPEYEGLGAGRLLLAAAEASLFREHVRIWLVTDGSDGIRANDFYQRHGWQKVANLDARDVRYEKQAGAVDRLLQDVRLVSETNFQLLCRVRELALAVAPDVHDEVKYGGVLFSRARPFGGVFAYAGHVSLELSQGASLDDPYAVLEGGGKQRRHIKLRTLDDIETRQVAHYLCSAATLAE
ncbi:ribosomal protein S18 acetylase RimI-like enzyme [Pseudomonas citronellolis]|nr:ribosomal protein S18 acetylase RimI-like enzyme [Pseudomonas citronellolis]MCP1669454.1 ribosomal protein S18 acetylase RimI-like enzyme [Pseudomonas citronellolis]MCP1699719.1 ribosomal protein S18 acetylase RimI-like enzyme [Pseudomonas citronellolis]MCP1707346.1 ribosomal protein S18 acetylase RimI-like enzyme [Pseudomonas citronellolis]MCP1801217.1 ribosomal protein S18 acetylase RimI-like enzyme [Pseudomonas citronellolis]